MKKNSQTDYVVITIVSVIYFAVYILQYTDGIFGNITKFPQLMLAAAVCSGLFFGDKIGPVFGFIIGAAVDAVSADTVCYNCIIMFLISYFCGVAVTYLINNNFKSIFIVMFVSVVVYYFGIFAISKFNVHLFKTHTLPLAIITYIFSIPFYCLIRAIIYSRKRYLQKHS